MARTIARLQVAALVDPDFQALTVNAQWTYWIILQQPRLTLAGSIDLRPTRWATVATDATIDQITTGITELAAHRYVIIDDDTEELLVRTFVRHDLDASRLAKNTVKGFWSAWSAIYSSVLRAAVIAEIDADLWTKLGTFAPVEAETMHATPSGATPTPMGTDPPTPMGTDPPTPMGTDVNPETTRSTPLERETPLPPELPVSCLLSPVTVPSQVVSPTGLGTDPPDPTTDDDDETNPDPPDLNQLAQAVAKARSQRLGGGHNPAWIRTVTNDINRHDLTNAVANGTTDPTELDQLLDGQQPATEPTPVHPAIAAANQPTCHTCEGMRQIETDHGVTPCPDCTANNSTTIQREASKSPPTATRDTKRVTTPEKPSRALRAANA